MRTRIALLALLAALLPVLLSSAPARAESQAAAKLRALAEECAASQNATKIGRAHV
jgi:hypothetical protein